MTLLDSAAQPVGSNAQPVGSDASPASPPPAAGADAPRVVKVHHLLPIAVWMLAFVVVAYFFAAIKVFVLGVLAACALAAALHPLMKWLPGPRGLRAVAIALVPPLLLAGILWGGGNLVAHRVAAEVRAWPQIQQGINETLGRWSQRLSLDEPLTLRMVTSRGAEALTGGGGADVFKTATSALSGVALALTFVFFGSLYLLAENPKQYSEPIRLLLPVHRRPQFDAAIRDLIPRLRWWFIGTLISMSVVGLLSSVGYWLVGLKMFLPVGLLSGFSEIVPTLGPATAFLFALLFAGAQGSGTAVGVIAVYAVVQTVESYILTPLVMKKAVEMPPLVTLFTIVLWGQIFGAPGLLLAIPLNLVIWTTVDHFVIRPRQVVLA